MSDTKRTLMAGFLIASLTLFIPFYLNFIGVSFDQEESDLKVDSVFEKKSVQQEEVSFVVNKNDSSLGVVGVENNVVFNVVNEKYSASLSSLGGGSFVSYVLSEEGFNSFRYLGGYGLDGIYNDSINVDLLSFGKSECNPCLSFDGGLEKITAPFTVVSPSVFSGQTLSLFGEDSLVVVMKANTKHGLITKETVFYGNNYLINHRFFLEFPSNVDVVWDGGIKVTEKNISEELTYSQAFLAQDKTIESFSFTPSVVNESYDVSSYSGKTDWVGVRNKYFINSLIASDASGGFLGGRTLALSSFLAPQYSVGLSFSGSKNVFIKQFFGPLDIDVISESGTYLDRVMNFGWLPIQPFSRLVLWLLKKLHLIGLNYGVVLIVFAVLIRILTGPLTKKSFQSSQKMQQVQPKMKKIQDRFKNDSQRLNQEMIKLYKEEGVNPLGGCLPMLIQMPLLFSLFIVFRSTIEFRGAPFMLWITDLSQPDVLFYLPFNIPIYGGHVGLLPIVLGVSMFLSQRLSMATMDPKQKPIMYFMSVFFFLLFNQFPSGLNLYYTAYNILNYFQQKSLKTL